MAKRSKKKSNKEIQNIRPENMLPQNILAVGEHVEENKNIYISQQVYKEIHRFTKNKTSDESGGMLVGSIIEEFGKTNIIISGFIEAKYSECTPTTMKFTHETWDYVHQEINKKHHGKKIVGWIHTHPDFGIFLSEYDKFIQQNFFSEDYQIAFVVDPIQNTEGFYFWINGKIEKFKGFYIYNKTGEKITTEIEKKEPSASAEKFIFSGKNIIILILSVVVIFLIFAQISTNSELKRLQKQIETNASNTNQNMIYIRQQLTEQSNEIENLKAILETEGSNIHNEENSTSAAEDKGKETAPEVYSDENE